MHPAARPRRGAARAVTWWGRAWVRGLEEAAYHDDDLRTARALSRGGTIGGLTVDRGRLVAAVNDARGLWTVSVDLPVLDAGSLEALVEVVAAQSGRVGALLAGDLPHSLVEHAEEAGVELLPFGSELAATCTCEAWVDPCPHALAVLYQATWLLEADPFVLLHLRGLPRDQLLAALHARTTTYADQEADTADVEADVEADDPLLDPLLDTAVDAALRAARVLELLADPEQPIDHLF